MDRRERVLAGLALNGLGLEVGGSHQPLAAGDPALRVRTLDYLDQAGLIAKYESMKVDPSRIQPVDYVWSGQRYADLVGEARFDWIVASHVIEHVPDLVGFVNECAEILTPKGRLSLAVPDRRCEFDYYRPASGLGSVIDAHLQGRKLSSPGLAAEFALYVSQLDGRDTWEPGDTGAPSLRFSDGDALALLNSARSGKYHDIHAWVFTAHGFRLLVEDLHRLGLLKLREANFHTSDGFEFFIQLSPDGAGPGLTRQELCERALEESRPLPPKAPSPELAPSTIPLQAVDSPVAHQPIETARTSAEADLREENDNLRRQLAALHNSTSWRITAPVRAVRRALLGHTT